MNNNNKFFNGNPNANFNSLTPNMMYQMNNQVSNFKNSYTSNTPLIEKQDYRNQNNMLHNNVGANVLSENVIEYSIHMDSYNRNINIYPNQFKFSVHFNDTTSPNIERQFKNIKYIRLENVILPTYFKIDISDNSIGTYRDASGLGFSNNSNYKLTNDRYLLLKIKELDNDRIFSTGNVIRSDTIKLYWDVNLNQFYDSWTTNQNSFVYTNSNLENIKRLSFELYNSYGDKLLMTHIATTSTDTTGNIIVTDPSGNNITNAPQLLMHPLNKYTQMEITLIFGVVQNDMNTEPNYSQ
jgi:hypothetical protein